MLRLLFTCPPARASAALLCLLGSAFAADASYTAAPLNPRTPRAAGARAFTALSPEQSGLTVPNVFNDPRMWGARFRELTLGAVETGIAVADFDRDGKPDIFAVSKNGPCALYRQTGDLTFTDVAAEAGVQAHEEGSSKTGVSVLDVNQDGAPDLYLCRYDAPNLLFVNDGHGRFTERSKEFGLDVRDASVHAVFADYDRDGAVDCYLVTNILDFSKSPQGRRDVLLHNDGGGKFTDVTAKSGVWGLTQGHTAIWCDFNHDGWPDLYVANDFETPDRMYLNKGDGTFVDVVDERLPHVTYFSMGADSGDLNNDGLVDFMVMDMRDRTHREYMAGMEELGRGLWEMERVTELIPQYMWNAVYLNTGTDRYAEVAHLTGMDATGWTWASRLGDLDNDGHLDVFVTCGMIRNFIDADLVDKQNVAPTLTARALVWKNAPPREETTLAFRNGGDLSFSDVSAEWGLDQRGVSFGCVQVDLDQDGDLDLVYANYERPPTVVRNNTHEGNRLVVKLAGRASNRDGIGAEIRLEAGGLSQLRQVFTERGIVASEMPVAHFGLGAATTVDRITIRWPRGATQVLTGVAANQLITIPEPAAADIKPAPAVFAQPPADHAVFAEAAQARGLKHTLALRPVDEFSRQRLLPRRLNGMAVALAVADVNADGHDDVFVGGGAGSAAQLFLGAANGQFAPAPEQPWGGAKEIDITEAVFFDANADGHPDLLLASGGVAHPQGDERLGDLLFVNQGDGRFVAARQDLLPADKESNDTLAAADFDGDGAIDLFIGGRVVPGKYPATPRSCLYSRRDGKLADVTDEVAPGLRDVGMVTAALWTDLDADRRIDLVVATEWGPIVWFKNTGGRLERAPESAGFEPLRGWWSALAAADVNGDGRTDLVAGNVGLNTKYRATAEEPTLLFVGDLDDRGREQIIEAQYEGGNLYPLRGRSKLSYAYPWLPKRFPTYRAFAEATVKDLFGERLAAARQYSANELRSGVFVQGAEGRFTFQPLPRMAQIAPINALVACDLDGDAVLDIFCGGNNFGPEPNTGRFDGGVGLLLKGDGKGGFRALNARDSGLLIPGDTRAAACVKLANQARPALVVARCDGPLLLFVPKE